MKKLTLFIAVLLAAFSAGQVFGQSAIIRGESSAGVYNNIQTDTSGYLFIRPYAATIPNTVANISRPADVTAYTAGDIVASTAVAADVVPITWTLPNATGRILGVKAVVTPAAGNLVITALDFDLLIFRSVSGIPFAAGAYPADNTALVVSAAAYRDLVGVYRFSSSAWRNPAGTLVAGVTGFQDVTVNSNRAVAPFDLTGLSANTLVGVIQIQGAWTPGAVINRFDFSLDVEMN